MTGVATTRPPEGFRAWVDPYQLPGPRPQHFKIVEVWQRGATETYLCEPAKMHPAQNVWGLYWRPIKSFGEDDN
jgi:hypothetical protein